MTEIDVLLVEDNRGDVHLIERAFEHHEIPTGVHTVQTGDEALDWLRRDDVADALRPDLVILDLNLPGTSGHTVLEEIKSDPRLKRIPVIVLTGSRSEDDLVAVYESYANACMIKPVDPDEFTARIGAIAEFWASTAAVPPAPERADGPGP